MKNPFYILIALAGALGTLYLIMRDNNRNPLTPAQTAALTAANPPQTITGGTPPAVPATEQGDDIVPNLGTAPTAPVGTGAAASYLATAGTVVTDTTGLTATGLAYTAANIAAGPRASDLASLAPLGTMFGRYAVVSYAAAQNADGNLYWYPVVSTTPS